MDAQESIGQTLTRRREERGLPPEAAAAASRVPLRLLQALESDDYRLLPDPLYLLRFLHDYGRFLGLDPAALEAAFRAAVRRPSRLTFASAAGGPVPPAIPWKQIGWTLAAVLVVIPLVFIALSLASKRAAERPPVPVAERAAESGERERLVDSGARSGAAGPSVELPAGAATSPSTAPTETPAAPVPPAPSGEVARAGVSPSPAPPAEPTRRQLLVAEASQATWLRVRPDGAEGREVLLQAGQRARFTADRTFLVTVGNAGGVRLSLNGAPLPALGAPGQVVRDLPVPALDAGASPGR